MDVLGIAADDGLLTSWRRWLAPELQPFFVVADSEMRERSAPEGRLSAELRDTYTVWRISRDLEPVWLDEEAFFEIPRRQRAALVRSQVLCGRGCVPTVRGWADVLDPARLRLQADGHRFVWWPSLLVEDPESIVERVVTGGGVPSKHRDVSASTWRECASVLPGARGLAGSFPASSGPNCFGTVMAASGVPGAAEEWMVQTPFLEWLRSACRPGGRDHDPGTVLVWRDSTALPVHAAVTIGDGWALEKPAQTWWTPRVVIRVEEVIRATRTPGLHLERHHIDRTAIAM